MKATFKEDGWPYSLNGKETIRSVAGEEVELTESLHDAATAAGVIEAPKKKSKGKQPVDENK